MLQTESLRKDIKTNMTIDDKIRDEKLQYDINREAAISSSIFIFINIYHQVKLINMNISQVKKYYLLKVVVK